MLLLLKSFRYAIAHFWGSFYRRRFYVKLNIYDRLVLKDENPSGGFLQSYQEMVRLCLKADFVTTHSIFPLNMRAVKLGAS